MSTVQSVERAFAVLATLVDGPIGVTEVAERAALPKSTAARMLASLAREDVVERLPGEARWRLGNRIVTLAAAVRPTRSLVALARPHLAELSEAVGEAVGLSIPDGFRAHYVDQVDGPHPVGVRDWTGTRLAMHAVSAGQVFLAHMHPVEVDDFLAGSLERFTPHTIVEPERLRDRLRQVQLDGYAWTRDEYADGISSIAAPIPDEDGDVVAAVHIHGPTYRFPAPTARSDAVLALIRCAGRIGTRLRGAGSSGS